MKRKLNIALAGLGTVGGEVMRLLQGAECPSGLNLVAASARRLRDMPDGVRFCPDPLELAGMKDVDIIAEMIGGEGAPAYHLVKAALGNGKHVITANKALIARYGAELAALAEANGVALNYEAAVCAAVPVVRTLRDYCPAGAVAKIDGVLNGTCNYILCEMERREEPLMPVLKRAQEQGYAEADAALDIDGLDAAHKLAILASLAFGRAPAMEAIEVSGIRHIELTDIQMARDLGLSIRLVAHAGTDGSAWVRPVAFPRDARLARLTGTRNGVKIAGQGVNLFLEGAGAGGRPTAYAMLADMTSIVAGIIRPPFGIPAVSLRKTARSRKRQSAKPAQWFLSLSMRDEAGAMASVSSVLAKIGLSIKSMVQSQIPRMRRFNQPNQDTDFSIARMLDEQQRVIREKGAGKFASLALMTHPAPSESVREVAKALDALPFLAGRVLLLRVLQESGEESGESGE